MTAGASNDIERAVEIARRMVAEFGMSPLGPIHVGKPDEQHSQALLDRIEKATSEIINFQMKRAMDAVRESRILDPNAGGGINEARYGRSRRDQALLRHG